MAITSNQEIIKELRSYIEKGDYKGFQDYESKLDQPIQESDYISMLQPALNHPKVLRNLINNRKSILKNSKYFKIIQYGVYKKVSVETLKFLLQQIEDIQEFGNNFILLLRNAASQHNLALIKTLINFYPDIVNHKNYIEVVKDSININYKKNDILDFLIINDPNPEHETLYNFFILNKAIAHQDIDFVNQLIHNNQDIVQDPNYFNFVEQAILDDKHDNKILELLINSDFISLNRTIYEFELSIIRGNTDLVNEFINNPSKFSNFVTNSKNYFNLVKKAISKFGVDNTIVKFLISNDPNPSNAEKYNTILLKSINSDNNIKIISDILEIYPSIKIHEEYFKIVENRIRKYGFNSDITKLLISNDSSEENRNIYYTLLLKNITLSINVIDLYINILRESNSTEFAKGYISNFISEYPDIACHTSRNALEDITNKLKNIDQLQDLLTPVQEIEKAYIKQVISNYQDITSWKGYEDLLVETITHRSFNDDVSQLLTSVLPEPLDNGTYTILLLKRAASKGDKNSIIDLIQKNPEIVKHKDYIEVLKSTILNDTTKELKSLSSKYKDILLMLVGFNLDILNHPKYTDIITSFCKLSTDNTYDLYYMLYLPQIARHVNNLLNEEIDSEIRIKKEETSEEKDIRRLEKAFNIKIPRKKEKNEGLVQLKQDDLPTKSILTSKFSDYEFINFCSLEPNDQLAIFENSQLRSQILPLSPDHAYTIFGPDGTIIEPKDSKRPSVFTSIPEFARNNNGNVVAVPNYMLEAFNNNNYMDAILYCLDQLSNPAFIDILISKNSSELTTKNYEEMINTVVKSKNFVEEPHKTIFQKILKIISEFFEALFSCFSNKKEEPLTPNERIKIQNQVRSSNIITYLNGKKKEREKYEKENTRSEKKEKPKDKQPNLEHKQTTQPSNNNSKQGYEMK